MTPSPATRFHELPSPFRMKRGGELRGARIAFETWGTLAPARDNAVLILTGLSPGAHAASSPDVVPHFLDSGAEVAAGVKQQLEMDARRLGGLRLLPGRFMVIRQAMGCPKSRGEAAAAALASFVEEMKASGFVAQALARHGVEGASVAPTGE